MPHDPALSNIITYNSHRFITKLRYQNEPVRHKMLDFFGDISLLGHRLLGEIIVYKPGHAFTRFIGKKILENLLNKEKFPNLAWLAEIFQAS